MICVYPADCTDFSTNGNGTLAPLSAEVMIKSYKPSSSAVV